MDVPLNNLRACVSMIAKDLIPEVGTNSFAIMKRLLKSHARKSHRPPQAHFSRVPGAFLADRIIVGRYPRYRMGKGPRLPGSLKL